MRQIHKDRYRIQFCNEEFYSQHQSLFKMWKTNFLPLSDVDKLLAWSVALSCLRRPDDWFGGARIKKIRESQTRTHPISLESLFSLTSVKIPKKLDSKIDLFTFLNCYRIKAVPESCFRTLCFMVDDTFPVDIVSGEISPLELLKKQIVGRRVVYLNEDYEEWPTKLYAQRDHLGFIFHDLIHADHFFSHPQNRTSQLGFYRWMWKLISSDQLQELCLDQNFLQGFEYIVSDMNSHPLHLVQTLHSLLYSSLNDDLQSDQIWNEWIFKSSTSSEILNALQKVNSSQFKLEDAKVIEEHFQKSGSSDDLTASHFNNVDLALH